MITGEKQDKPDKFKRRGNVETVSKEERKNEFSKSIMLTLF
jgi:hypothetical protein